MRSIRATVAFLAFAAIMQCARPAAADVTITGTVGEIGIVSGNTLGNTAVFYRFKLTDANQTKTCAPANPFNQVGAGYAWFANVTNFGGFGAADSSYREVYAMLLLSKKGAMISCTIDTSTNCHVTSCTLP